MNYNRYRVVFALLALLLAGFIWYLSGLTGTHMPPLFPHQDKVMHLGIYALLGFLLAGVLRRSADDTRATVLVTTVILAGLYGLADEVHQSFVPGRDPSALDLVADITGGLLGALTMHLFARRYLRQADN